ncbi:hypothetical protein [Streptomyces sp. NPDC001889]
MRAIRVVGIALAGAAATLALGGPAALADEEPAATGDSTPSVERSDPGVPDSPDALDAPDALDTPDLPDIPDSPGLPAEDSGDSGDESPGKGGGGGGTTSFDFTVTPAAVAPGGTVTLNTVACQSPTVTVSSEAFETVTLQEGRPGTARISEDAEPGAEYEITFDCAGEKGLARFTVGGGPAHNGEDGGTDAGIGALPPGEAETPGGGVRAGTGGSTDALSPARTATGSVLVAGALGGGAVLAYRRRAGNRG